jgi:intein/homing endonuclease
LRIFFEEDDRLLFGLSDLGAVPPPMTVSIHHIPGGDRGTRATLERMRKIVIDSLKDPKHGAFLRGLAIKITLEAGCKTKEFMCEAKSLGEWVRDNIKWIRDTRGFETLQYPYRTLAFGAGDCDDLCLSGSTTYIWVKINGRLCRMTLKELYKHFMPVSSRKLVMAGTHTVDHVDDEEFLKPAENLKVEILSTRGKGHKDAKVFWRTVTRMYHKTAPVDLLKITISGGRSITCTANHRFYRSSGDYFVPVRAGELSVGDNVVSVHEIPGYSEFPSMLSDEDLFMLGFWIAHGCYEHEYGPKFACGKDEVLAKRVHAWAATRKNNWDNQGGSSVSPNGDVTVRSRALMAWMKELGFEGTSATKRVPSWVFELPNEQLKHFLAGCFKGDGSIYKTVKRTEIVICSANRDLLCDVLELLNRFGIEGVINTKSSNGVPCADHHLSITSKSMVEKFIDKIVNSSDREIVLQGGSRMNYPVSSQTVCSIERVREYEIFDLEVEPDHKLVVDPDREHVFVANGFLTHNSILLASLSTSIGIPTKFRAIAANPMRKDQFSHVYVMMDPMGQGRWISSDPTVKSAPFGWECPIRYKVMDLEI